MLWKQDEALTHVSEAKKSRYGLIVTLLSYDIQTRYEQEFSLLSKFGGIPMVFRDFRQICDMFALVLVRNFRNDEKKVLEELADTVVPGIMDPCKPFIKDINMRLPNIIADELFADLEANSVDIGPERFVRRVAGAAAAAVLRGVKDEVIDLKKFPGSEELQRIKVAKRTRAHYEDHDEKRIKRAPDPTYGVARNAPRVDLHEHRITLQFYGPRAKVYAHVPIGIPMEEVLDYIITTYPDVEIMLEQRGTPHGLFWQDAFATCMNAMNAHLFVEGDCVFRQWFQARHPSTHVLRSRSGIYVTLDALPYAKLKDTVNFVTACRTLHEKLDALIDTPFAEGKTEFYLNIPNQSSNFESKSFSIKPRSGLLVKYASFKDKLVSVIAKMKNYADERLVLHSTQGKWYKSQSCFMKGTELVFYRNVSRSSCKIFQNNQWL
jgi:hypothetical protein